MPKRFNLFQDVIATVQAHMSPGSEVEESAFLKDVDTGAEREVDVVVRGEHGGYPALVKLEAIDRGRPATVDWVDGMLGKHARLEPGVLVLVSASGFSARAARKAQVAGAFAVTPAEVDESLGAKLVEAAAELRAKLLRFVSREVIAVLVAATGVEYNGELIPEVSFVLDDQTVVMSAGDYITACFNLQLSKILDATMQYDTPDQTAPATLHLTSISVRRGGTESLPLYVAHPATGELLRIAGVTAHGDMVVSDGRVELSYRETRGTTYGFGRTRLGSDEATVVASNAGGEAQMTLRLRGPDGTLNVLRLE